MQSPKGCLRLVVLGVAISICFPGIGAIINLCKETPAKHFSYTSDFVLLGIGVALLLYLLCTRKSAPGAKGPKGVYLTKEQIDKLTHNQEIPLVDAPVRLKDGEYSIFYCDATKQEITNKAVGQTGKYRSMSIQNPVFKSVKHNFGKMSSETIYEDVSSQYAGQLVITTNRLIFIHYQKGFEVSFDDVTALQIFLDGLSIQCPKGNFVLLLSKPKLLKALFDSIDAVGLENLPALLSQRQTTP